MHLYGVRQVWRNWNSVVKGLMHKAVVVGDWGGKVGLEGWALHYTGGKGAQKEVCCSMGLAACQEDVGREALSNRERVWESISQAGCRVKLSLISLCKTLVNFMGLTSVFGLNGLSPTPPVFINDLRVTVRTIQIALWGGNYNSIFSIILFASQIAENYCLKFPTFQLILKTFLFFRSSDHHHSGLCIRRFHNQCWLPSHI